MNSLFMFHYLIKDDHREAQHDEGMSNSHPIPMIHLLPVDTIIYHPYGFSYKDTIKNITKETYLGKKKKKKEKRMCSISRPLVATLLF